LLYPLYLSDSIKDPEGLEDEIQKESKNHIYQSQPVFPIFPGVVTPPPWDDNTNKKDYTTDQKLVNKRQPDGHVFEVTDYNE
jgi:hypothetical protein